MMAPRKAKAKGAEGDLAVENADTEVPASGDEEEETGNEDPSPGRFKDGGRRGVGRTRSVVGRNFMSERLRFQPPPEDDEEEEGVYSQPWGRQHEGNQGWMQAIVAEVSSSVCEEIKDLVAERGGSSVTSKDIEDVRAAQRLTDLQSEAARLNSEGAQLQFIAFGKVKAGVADAIRLLKSHETLPAIKLLEEVERVADLRIDVIRRAGSAPGAWAAATIYEKRMLAESSDAKNDKVWEAALAEATSKKMKTKVSVGDKRKSPTASGGPSSQYRFFSRGQSTPFRGLAYVYG